MNIYERCCTWELILRVDEVKLSPLSKNTINKAFKYTTHCSNTYSNIRIHDAGLGVFYAFLYMLAKPCRRAVIDAWRLVYGLSY